MSVIKLISRLLPLLLLGLTACGDVRDLPTEKVITIFNSNLEKTNKMDMLDTLYVQVGGLRSNELHTIEALDPDGNLISKLTVMSDENGVIAPSAVWYDVGLRKDTKKPDIGGSLSLKAFNIRVTGPGGTDYKEPFYIIYSQNNVGEQPKPVVWATASSTGDGVEHAFQETGTKDADGNPGKTKVYVEATNIPAAINSAGVTSVDIYVLPSKGAGNLWAHGETLTDKFKVRKLNVAVVDDASTGSKKLTPTLVWDLDVDPILVNPGENNNSFDVIIDVNRDGKFDVGEDVNNDGRIDRYIDGIMGQGVVGFIVTNTPANDFFVTLTDELGNKTDAINETVSVLKIEMDNLPAGSAPVLHLYHHLTTTDAITPVNLPVSAASGTVHYLPYVESTAFIDTRNANPLNPANVTNANTLAYDVEVTGVGTTSYTTTIKVMHPAADLKVTDGVSETAFFDETGTTPNGKTQVYVKTVGMSLNGTTTVYVVPSKEGGWNNGMVISNVKVSEKADPDPITGNLADTLVWDLNTSPQLKNPTSANNTYDVILDADNDGIFDASSDLVVKFVVRDTAANNLPELLYANIASGGKFSYNYTNWSYDYDYRDSFSVNGQDTLKSYYVGYGIKAIWNPYITYYGDTNNTTETPSLYYGAYVDVYIVDADKTANQLNRTNLSSIKLGQGDFKDVAGGKKTVPVQSSCSNGSGQQNIWVPKFAKGRYYVIVDVNSNGELDERIDIIDAVDQKGWTIKDDPSVVGFTVD